MKLSLALSQLLAVKERDLLEFWIRYFVIFIEFSSRLLVINWKASETCPYEYTVSGFDSLNGVYRRAPGQFLGNVYYVRTEPSVMYVSRNVYEQDGATVQGNWFYSPELGAAQVGTEVSWSFVWIV